MIVTVIVVTVIACVILAVPGLLGAARLGDRRQERRQRRFDSEQRRRLGK